MPELPEVETVKRDLILSVLGKKIQAIRVLDARIIRDVSVKQFVALLTGRIIQDISRRGKAIVWTFDNSHHFVIQLMMTGQLVFLKKLPETFLKDTKVIFELSNGTYLLYNDQRLFGRLSPIEDLKSFKHFANLGPEPFDDSFNPQFIKDALKKRKTAIKSALLDHTFVAGIGNIYASEILFRSQIDPRRRAQRLKLAEIERMHRVTVEVLEEAIQYRGSSMRNYRDGQGQKGLFNQRIKVYAREDDPCEVCAKPIVRIVQSGRSTFFCKGCQK